MHGKMMHYLLVAGAAVIVGLLIAGTPLASLVPVLLACPLMMIFMMQAMHGQRVAMVARASTTKHRATLTPVAAWIVDDIVTGYLDLVDTEVPGLVEGLYLVGSIALGDFQPGSSDIDFVAVTATRPSEAALAGLTRVHDRLRTRWPRPRLDGAYHTWADLAGPAGTAGPTPYVHEGRLHPPRAGGDSPVTWQMVAQHGIARRGPQPSTVDIHLDPAALAAWSDANLDTYWRPWLARSRSLLCRRGWFALTPYATVWLVTGVSRLHYAIATGEVISKTDAARYALRAFPSRWHPVISEALRIRQADLAGSTPGRALIATARDYVPARGQPRPLLRTPVARRRHAVAFADMAIDDAHRLYRRRAQGTGV